MKISLNSSEERNGVLWSFTDARWKTKQSVKHHSVSLSFRRSFRTKNIRKHLTVEGFPLIPSIESRNGLTIVIFSHHIRNHSYVESKDVWSRLIPFLADKPSANLSGFSFLSHVVGEIRIWFHCLDNKGNAFLADGKQRDIFTHQHRFDDDVDGVSMLISAEEIDGKIQSDVSRSIRSADEWMNIRQDELLTISVPRSEWDEGAKLITICSVEIKISNNK